MDAVHGGTGAGHRVQAEHGFIRVVDRQPVDQAKLSTDPPFATRRGQIDLFPDEFSRANPARCLDGLHGTFRVDNYVDVGVEGPSRVDLAGCEPGMYRAMPLPQDHLGIAELLRSISTQLAERIPDHHLIEGNTHIQARVAAQVLVAQEQDPLSLIESPLKHHLGVG